MGLHALLALSVVYLATPVASFSKPWASCSRPGTVDWRRAVTTIRAEADSSAAALSRDPEIAGGALADATFGLQVAVAVLEGLRAHTSAERPLNLLEHTFDAATGLVSPGVWHNAVTGYAAIQAARALELTARDTTDQAAKGECAALAGKYRAWARDIGASLHAHNFVANQGFRRRPVGAAGGAWASAFDPAVRQQLLAAGEDPSFYDPSAVRRGGANAMAVLLNSFLAEEFPDDAEVAAQFSDAALAFTRQFFDPACGRFRAVAVGDQGVGDQPEEWRAVDQAVGALACARLAKAAGPRRGFEARAMAAAGAQSLLEQFGYGPCAEGEGGGGVANHFPPRRTDSEVDADDRPDRTSWADGWACLAIVVTEACSGRESARVLVCHTHTHP